LLLRIRVDGAELTRVLGGTYRRYQQHTERLISGLW
jgi:protein-S-isoprenylcysteine O-methyltransferase Ste14